MSRCSLRAARHSKTTSGVLSVSSTRRALWSCRSPSTKRDGTKPGAASDYVSVVTMGISKGGGNRWRVEGRGSGVVESGAPTRGRCHKGRCLEKGDGFRRAGKTSPYPVGAANGGRRWEESCGPRGGSSSRRESHGAERRAAYGTDGDISAREFEQQRSPSRSTS